MIRTDGHDLIDKSIIHLVWFKVVQTEDCVKPLADFVFVVLVLGQFNALGTAWCIIIICSLPAKVVGAPQIISIPVSSLYLFSNALWDLANSRPGHFLMLSPHLFLCLPCLLPPFTVPCKMILAGPDERET